MTRRRTFPKSPRFILMMTNNNMENVHYSIEVSFKRIKTRKGTAWRPEYTEDLQGYQAGILESFIIPDRDLPIKDGFLVVRGIYEDRTEDVWINTNLIKKVTVFEHEG